MWQACLATVAKPGSLFKTKLPNITLLMQLDWGQEMGHNAKLKTLGKATLELGYLTQFNVGLILTFSLT